MKKLLTATSLAGIALLASDEPKAPQCWGTYAVARTSDCAHLRGMVDGAYNASARNGQAITKTGIWTILLYYADRDKDHTITVDEMRRVYVNEMLGTIFDHIELPPKSEEPTRVL